MSDHGESLGENGVYLHGLPYFLAPKEQKHIAAFMWFGNKFQKKIDLTALRKQSTSPLSHDNLSHTLLGAFDVSTDIYKKEKDILYRSKK